LWYVVYRVCVSKKKTFRLLHRFLSARKYDTEKAGELLRKHVVWRFGVYRPFDIRCHDVEAYARTGCIQVRDCTVLLVCACDEPHACIQVGKARCRRALRCNFWSLYQYMNTRTFTHQVSPHGRDKWGRPIVIMDDSKDCIQETDPRKKQVVRARVLVRTHKLRGPRNETKPSQPPRKTRQTSRLSNSRNINTQSKSARGNETSGL
jgi:hypothetical protein